MSWFMEQVRKLKEHNVREKPAVSQEVIANIEKWGYTPEQLAQSLWPSGNYTYQPHPSDSLGHTFDGLLNLINNKTNTNMNTPSKERRLTIIAFMRTYYKMRLEMDEHPGLCKIKELLFTHDWITSEEEEWLTRFMADNSPKGHTVGSYWWPQSEPTPRFEWLENMHAKIKNEIDIISMIESVIDRYQSIHAGCMPNFLVMHPDKARELLGSVHTRYDSSTSIDSNESSLSYKGIPIIRSFDVLPNQIMHP